MFLALARWVYSVEAYVFNKKISKWPSVILFWTSLAWALFITIRMIFMVIDTL